MILNVKPGDVKPPLGSNQLVHGLQVGVDNIKRGSEDIIMEGLKKYHVPLKKGKLSQSTNSS